MAENPTPTAIIEVADKSIPAKVKASCAFPLFSKLYSNQFRIKTLTVKYKPKPNANKTLDTFR